MRRLRVFLLVGLLVAGILLFLRSSFWSLAEIRVEGNEALSTAEVIRLSGLVPGQNLFRIREQEVRERLLLHPRIKAVDLRYCWPDTVVVQVEERRAVGAIPVQGWFWEVDGEGTLLGSKAAWPGKGVPLLTGMTLPAAKPLPGERVAAPEAAGLLAVARRLAPEMRAVVQEIHYSNAEGISLFTTNGIEVYLGRPDELETKLILFWAIYREKGAAEARIPVTYIDVSHPKAPVLRFAGAGG
ncbi:MAG: FtsQ-type POTRA domain-containing protein [Clostridia bacterium]|nr:FtsQ-type POTRA domain-containing protein [Clostridia bacterium]